MGSWLAITIIGELAVRKVTVLGLILWAIALNFLPLVSLRDFLLSMLVLIILGFCMIAAFFVVDRIERYIREEWDD